MASDGITKVENLQRVISMADLDIEYFSSHPGRTQKAKRMTQDRLREARADKETYTRMLNAL